MGFLSKDPTKKNHPLTFFLDISILSINLPLTYVRLLYINWSWFFKWIMIRGVCRCDCAQRHHWASVKKALGEEINHRWRKPWSEVRNRESKKQKQRYKNSYRSQLIMTSDLLQWLNNLELEETEIAQSSPLKEHIREFCAFQRFIQNVLICLSRAPGWRSGSVSSASSAWMWCACGTAAPAISVSPSSSPSSSSTPLSTSLSPSASWSTPPSWPSTTTTWTPPWTPLFNLETMWAASTLLPLWWIGASLGKSILEVLLPRF